MRILPLEKRKQNRLEGYDYSQNGAYFLTICAKDMKCIFWNEQTHSAESSDDTSHLSYIGLWPIRQSVRFRFIILV